jgi:hypothetical protein
MEIIVHTEPFHHIIIKDLYTEEENTDIMAELLFLSSGGKLKGPEDTGSAKEGGTDRLLKKNLGIQLDSTYSDRSVSDILRITSKVFPLLFERNLTDASPNPLLEDSWYFSNLCFDRTATLVFYYEDSDYYEAHRDDSVVTMLTWKYADPKSFKGGDLKFPFYNDYTIPVDKSTTILMPSAISHEVTEVSMLDSDKGKQLGRFVITTFMNIGGV